MNAGKRDTLITLERATVTTDGYGEEVSTWASIGTEWAAVFYGRGDERRQAAMVEGRQPATFQVLANTVTRSLTLKDRITVDAVAWDILGIAPMDRATLDIVAAKAA